MPATLSVNDPETGQQYDVDVPPGTRPNQYDALVQHVLGHAQLQRQIGRQKADIAANPPPSTGQLLGRAFSPENWVSGGEELARNTYQAGQELVNQGNQEQAGTDAWSGGRFAAAGKHLAGSLATGAVTAYGGIGHLLSDVGLAETGQFRRLGADVGAQANTAIDNIGAMATGRNGRGGKVSPFDAIGNVADAATTAAFNDPLGSYLTVEGARLGGNAIENMGRGTIGKFTEAVKGHKRVSQIEPNDFVQSRGNADQYGRVTEVSGDGLKRNFIVQGPGGASHTISVMDVGRHAPAADVDSVVEKHPEAGRIFGARGDDGTYRFGEPRATKPEGSRVDNTPVETESKVDPEFAYQPGDLPAGPLTPEGPTPSRSTEMSAGTWRTPTGTVIQSEDGYSVYHDQEGYQGTHPTLEHALGTAGEEAAAARPEEQPTTASSRKPRRLVPAKDQPGAAQPGDGSSRNEAAARSEDRSDQVDRTNTESGEAPGVAAELPRLMVFRHGETGLNDKGRIRGWADGPEAQLNENGHEQAHRLGEQIDHLPQDRKPEIILTSDLGRASDTASIVSDHTDIPVYSESGLRPWHMGHLTGKDQAPAINMAEDYARNHPDEPLPYMVSHAGNASREPFSFEMPYRVFADSMRRGDAFQRPVTDEAQIKQAWLNKGGGESFNEFKMRFLSTVQRIESEHPNQRVMISTHSRGERLLEAWYKAGRPDNYDVDLDTMFAKGGEPGSMKVLGGSGEEALPEASKANGAPERKGKWISVERIEPLQREQEEAMEGVSAGNGSRRNGPSGLSGQGDLATAAIAKDTEVPKANPGYGIHGPRGEDVSRPPRFRPTERGSIVLPAGAHQAVADAGDSLLNATGGNLNFSERHLSDGTVAAIKQLADTEGKAAEILHGPFQDIQVKLRPFGDVQLMPRMLTSDINRGISRGYGRLALHAMTGPVITAAGAPNPTYLAEFRALEDTPKFHDIVDEYNRRATDAFGTGNDASVRDLLARVFARASANALTTARMIVPDTEFDSVKATPLWKQALGIYKRSIEPVLAASHASNAGTAARWLGEFDAYYPRQPLDEHDNPLRRMPTATNPEFKTPSVENRRSTGQSADYDTSVPMFRRYLRSSLRLNQQAVVMRGLRADGALVDEVGTREEKDGSGQPTGVRWMTLPDGSHYIASRVPTSIRGEHQYAPAPIVQELGPILHTTLPEWRDEGVSMPPAFLSVMHVLNSLGLQGPTVLTSHTENVLGTLAQIMMQHAGIPGYALGQLPFVQRINAVVQLLRVDTSSPEFHRTLGELASIGAVPQEYGTHTVSRQFAAETGATPVFPPHTGSAVPGTSMRLPKFSDYIDHTSEGRYVFKGGSLVNAFLFGRNGLDIRGRVLIWDMLRDEARVPRSVSMLDNHGQFRNPTMAMRFGKAVERLGKYVYGTESGFVRFMKRSGLGPTATAATTMSGNAVRFLPAAALGVATWYVTHKLLTGRYPGRNSRLGYIPFEWKGKQYELDFVSSLNTLYRRGMNISGASGGYNAYHGGESPRKIGEQAVLGPLHGIEHVTMGGPGVGVGFRAATLHHPYITRLVNDRTGKPDLGLMPAVQNVPPGPLGVPRAMAEAGIGPLNPMGGLVQEALGIGPEGMHTAAMAPEMRAASIGGQMIGMPIKLAPLSRGRSGGKMGLPSLPMLPSIPNLPPLFR